MIYSAKDIENILGIPTRRIQFYIESGLIEVDSPGRGRRGREFNRDHLLQLAMINTLSNKAGIDLSTIKKIFYNLRIVGPERLECSTYEVDDPAGYFIAIYDGGEHMSFPGEREVVPIERNGEVYATAGGAKTKITVDLSTYETVSVININSVYQKIKW